MRIEQRIRLKRILVKLEKDLLASYRPPIRFLTVAAVLREFSLRIAGVRGSHIRHLADELTSFASLTRETKDDLECRLVLKIASLWMFFDLSATAPLQRTEVQK